MLKIFSVPMSQMQKKRRIFIGLSCKIFTFQQLFLWLQKVVLDLIYWIEKKKLILPAPDFIQILILTDKIWIKS